eukprot:TRINITY_DN35764_c0_g1_i1.p1 TRINITY_DN35764_c0_g1~~TRINITY_DN35764_c0_g1_i1.p1  ORF type:complete len:108 (-),score=19.32 TRINITY_DN35764_c0_g1_i1:605-901(-)
MAAAVRTLKTVRPHIPLIKFRMRGDPAPVASSPAVTSVSAVSSPSGNPSSSSSSAAGSKPVGSTARGSGIDDLDLPKKYQRKVIDVDEMEYIERGGPA